MVQGIFVFTLITGIIVLLAALQSQKADRRREFELQVSINFGVILFGTLAGAVLVSVAAWFNLKGLLEITPVALLKG